jgi:putative glutamine amidotransferase
LDATPTGPKGSDVKSEKPLIGVSMGFRDYGDYIAFGFQRPITRAGGVPVILPRLPEAINELLDRCDGLVLAGGRDILPERYGQEVSDALGRTDPRRDAFEFDLVERALERQMPLLGFCRGMQVLNVAFGGTLHQDVRRVRGWADHPCDPDLVLWREVVAAALDDRLAPAYPTHPISVDPGSLLYRALGQTEVEVTSFHHQAVDVIGESLRVVARAPDGVVEGIEGDPFVLGVQFELHEEARINPKFEPVWEQFVVAASERIRV